MVPFFVIGFLFFFAEWSRDQVKRDTFKPPDAETERREMSVRGGHTPQAGRLR
jgi:hypothetical protein